jgi:MFS family permease
MLVETLDGLRVAGQDGFVRTLIIASAASVLFMAMANVGELVLAVDALDAGETGFTLLAAAMCAGTALGSLAGGRPLSDSARCAGFVGGLLVAGIGYALAAGSPSLAAAIAAFVVIGLGNGLALVSERILLQQRVPERFKGRTFGVRGMLHSWAFVGAFLSAGGLITALGVRPLFLLVAAGTLTTCACAAVALRGPVRLRAAAPQLGTT